MLAKQPRQVRIGIVGDETAADAFEAAQGAEDEARLAQLRTRLRRLAEHQAAGTPDPLAAVNADDDDALHPLEEATRAAHDALDKATLWFTFAALGRVGWAALVAEHPPTDEDHTQARETAGNPDVLAGWHRATLIPAAIQASCAQPKLTAEDVEDMFGGGAWNDAELAALTTAALSVNTAARTR